MRACRVLAPGAAQLEGVGPSWRACMLPVRKKCCGLTEIRLLRTEKDAREGWRASEIHDSNNTCAAPSAPPPPPPRGHKGAAGRNARLARFESWVLSRAAAAGVALDSNYYDVVIVT